MTSLLHLRQEIIYGLHVPYDGSGVIFSGEASGDILVSILPVVVGGGVAGFPSSFPA